MKNAISIEQPRPNVLQRAKWQYVSLAAGLALAATAAVSFGGTLSGPAAPATARPATAAIRPTWHQEPGTVVFYLTSGPEAAALATAYEEMATWVRHDNGIPEPRRSVQILDASTEASAASARKLVDDAMAAANFTSEEAPRFVVVDLR